MYGQCWATLYDRSARVGETWTQASQYLMNEEGPRLGGSCGGKEVERTTYRSRTLDKKLRRTGSAQNILISTCEYTSTCLGDGRTHGIRFFAGGCPLSFRSRVALFGAVSMQRIAVFDARRSTVKVPVSNWRAYVLRTTRRCLDSYRTKWNASVFRGENRSACLPGS